MRPSPLVAVLLAVGIAGPVAAATPAPASGSPTCLPGPVRSAQRLDDWTLEVTTTSEGRRFRIDLDRGCPGVKEGEAMQLASTAERVCADGRAAAVTASAICPVAAITGIEAAADAPRCFGTARVRQFAALRGNRLEVQLRGGDRHILQLEASCAQLDRFAAVRLVSGADDGRICGRPGDAVYGSFDDGMGATMSGGFARQFSSNDFQPCRIVEVLPPERDEPPVR